MTDVLVIGAGGAGLVSAITAKQSGASVKVVGKSFPTRSQTCMAQGGINAVFKETQDDSIESHIKDTLKSAQDLADKKAVYKLCEEAEDAVRWLDNIGLPFSRTKEGEISQRRLGGASGSRACYAQDYTGLKIVNTLYDRASKIGVEFINEHFLLNYIIENHPTTKQPHVCGAIFLDIKSTEVIYIKAKTVIIATGGYSRIYHANTTNSTASTGDGIAAALRAGAKVSDLEFVQFHPTALKNSSILISESARGAGGYLLDANKQRFTDELAPRDIVARAILDEINKSAEVYLDIRHLGEGFIEHELPQERKLAMIYEGIDPVADLIPIRPVAHYTMGGVDVDDSSMTSISALFAVGEAANHKVHGANRLGGNSLLELIVFGRQAGANAADYANSCDIGDFGKEQIQADTEYISKLLKTESSVDFYEKREYIGEMFYKNVGIKRNEKELSKTLVDICQIKQKLHLMGVRDRSKIYNTNLVDFLEFKNILELAEVVLINALNRKESRGAHFREDMPKIENKFSAHSVSWYKNSSLFTEFIL